MATVSRVESAAERRLLYALLDEFHGWMVDGVGDGYDREIGLREDAHSLATEPESWAWIARLEGDPAGCVLLYGLADDLAEFKRLWVRPAHRRKGVGRMLMGTVMAAARREGYSTLGLTTTPWADPAIAMYESLGFEHTSPYPETRLDAAHHDAAVFMQLDLDGTGPD